MSMFCIQLFTKSYFIWRLTDHLQLIERYIQNKWQENLTTQPVFQNEQKHSFGDAKKAQIYWPCVTQMEARIIYEGMRIGDRQS